MKLYRGLPFFMFFAVWANAEKISTSDTMAPYVESGVISLADRQGFRWQTKDDQFLLNPYLLVQGRGQFNRIDDEGLNLADPDNIVNTGFGIPGAILGLAGRAFGMVTYNFALNAAQAGKPSLLNQVWFDVNLREEFRIRTGKFKTPMHRAYLVRVGQTLFPVPPSLLTTRMNLPYSINAVNPTFTTGFDIGVMGHGTVGNRFEYQAGIFNGTGIGVNMPNNTVSDETGMPSLLYAARGAWTPLGKMPIHEGYPGYRDGTKLSVAASTSYNIEANYESSNDFRAGVEAALITDRIYWSTEAFFLHMDFVERQRLSSSYFFWGTYTQFGYLIGKWQPTARFEVFDRNSVHNDGLLIIPSIGVNIYPFGQNLKLQVMYRHLIKYGHESEFYAHDDDNGLAEHMAVVQFQFAL